jgi:RNA-directed DNA polymerase
VSYARSYGLQLNEEKTRIVPRHERQWVTGAVVNKSAAPPRQFRRRLRAIFHEANKDPARFANEVHRLTGYLGYLQGFPSLRNSTEISHYRSIIDRVRRT